MQPRERMNTTFTLKCYRVGPLVFVPKVNPERHVRFALALARKLNKPVGFYWWSRRSKREGKTHLGLADSLLQVPAGLPSWVFLEG